MSNTKIFKKDIFAALAEIIANEEIGITIPEKGTMTAEEVAAFLNHEIELITRKNTGSTKPTEKQIENEGIKKIILETLEGGKSMTISELQKASPELAKYQNQKLSAIIRLMIKDDNSIVRTVNSRKAYFSLA